MVAGLRCVSVLFGGMLVLPGSGSGAETELGRNFGVRWLISGWLESLSLFLCVDFRTRWLHLPVGAAVSFRWHGRLAVAGLGDRRAGIRQGPGGLFWC